MEWFAAALLSATLNVNGQTILDSDVQFWDKELQAADDNRRISKVMLAKVTELYNRKLVLSQKKESMPSDSAVAESYKEDARTGAGSILSADDVAQEKTTGRKRPGYWTDYQRGPRPPGYWTGYGARRRLAEVQSAEKTLREALHSTKDQDKAARAEPEDALATAAAREDTAVPPPLRRSLALRSRNPLHRL